MAANFGFDPNLPPEIAAENERISRQQAVAQAMMQSGMTPLPTNQGPLHWTQGLAQIFNAYSGRRGADAAEADRSGLGQRYKAIQDAEIGRLQKMMTGTPASSENIVDEQANGGEGAPATINAPAVKADPRGAINEAIFSTMPRINQWGTMTHKTFENEQTRAADREARSLDRLAALDAAAANQALAREERAARAAEAAALRREIEEGRKQDAAANRQLRVDLSRGRNTGQPKPPAGYRFSATGEELEPIPGGPRDKPAQLPSAALKLQQGELDGLAIAKNIAADLTAVHKLMESGKLEVGPVENLWSMARNKTNQSSENSRNFNTFKTTLDRLRNDSLRLNKGTQTEGDAIRAWNELIGSISDQELVKERLKEITEINERAANIRRMNIDSIRSNYGMPAMDTTGYENQGPAINRGNPDEPPPGAVRRR